MRRVWLTAISMLLVVGCRAGGAARAVPMPHPENFGQWVGLAAFVLGIWFVALKILGRL